MKRGQRSGEEGLKVKKAVGSRRYFCARRSTVWTCLKAQEEVQGQRKERSQEEPGLLAKAVALTTIDSALVTLMRRGLRSLLLSFPEMACLPGGQPASSLLLMDCWGQGQEEQGPGTQPGPLGAELAGEGEGLHLQPQEFSPMRINRPLGARPQWHQQAEGDELGPRSLILTVGLRVFCWLVWSSPTTPVSRFFPELLRQTLVGEAAPAPAPRGKETRFTSCGFRAAHTAELGRLYSFQGKSESRNETTCKSKREGAILI